MPRVMMLALLLLFAVGEVAAADPRRRFTVEDSIRISTFVPPGGQFYQTTPRVLVSPDGARYLAVTLKGDLESNRRVATFWEFDGKAVRSWLSSRRGPAPAPRAITTWASGANRDPVSRWRWSSDSKSLLFLAASDEGVRRLIRVDLATGAPTQLSPADQDVTLFDEQAGRVVFLAHDAQPESTFHVASGNGLPDVVRAAGQNILPLLFPNEYAVSFQDRPDTLWRVDDDGPRPVGDGSPHGRVELVRSRITLSPDGHRLLATTYAKRVPAAWERYRPQIEDPAFQYVADKPGDEPKVGIYRPQQFSIVNLGDGASRLLLDTPIEFTTTSQDISAAWSADGSQVALVGAFPPLEPVPHDRVGYCELSVVQVETHEFACLRPADARQQHFSARPVVAELRWMGAGSLQVALAPPRDPAGVTREFYHLGPHGWTRAPAVARPRDLAMRVQEAIDEPPVVAARIGSDPERVVFDPNPQLGQIAMGSVVPYAWRDPDGTQWSGALVQPPDYDPHRRYPLVIQTHNLDRARFLVDGPSATGFAARALAGRDILVLQVDEIGKDAGTPKESRSGAAAYKAAILQLTSEGQVDLARVGIITWSHMDSYAMQGLVDDPHLYAAATFAEAADASYPIYLINIDYMGTAREQMVRAQVGPKPFGQGLRTWIAEAQGFQLDRVCTPVLFQVNEPTSLVYTWSAYAALRAQAKPVDLLYIRSGAHVLVKPQQRLVEQGMNVDWFDFWLNGRSEASPGKQADIKRWEQLRAGPRCGESPSSSGARP